MVVPLHGAGLGDGGDRDALRVAQRGEAAVAPARDARVVGGHDPVVVARVGRQAGDARAHAPGALPAARAGLGGALAIARARAVLEVVGRRAAVGVDRGRQARRDRRDVARRARGRPRRPGRGRGPQGVIAAARGPGRVGRHHAVVVGGVGRQPAEVRGDVDRSGARAGVGVGALQAIAGRRPVLEAIGRRAPLRVDGARDGRRRLGHVLGGAGGGARRAGRDRGRGDEQGQGEDDQGDAHRPARHRARAGVALRVALPA